MEAKCSGDCVMSSDELTRALHITHCTGEIWPEPCFLWLGPNLYPKTVARSRQEKHRGTVSYCASFINCQWEASGKKSMNYY